METKLQSKQQYPRFIQTTANQKSPMLILPFILKESTTDIHRAVTLYSIENGIFQGDRIDAEKLKSLIKDIHISFRLNPETGRPEDVYKRQLINTASP